MHTTTEEDLLFHQGSDKYPVVIHIAADVDTPKQSLSAYATFERSGSGQLSLRPLVQKAHINGMFLVLKEIFGIERKDDNNDNGENDDDDDNTGTAAMHSDVKLCTCQLEMNRVVFYRRGAWMSFTFYFGCSYVLLNLA